MYAWVGDRSELNLGPQDETGQAQTGDSRMEKLLIFRLRALYDSEI
jgi:hypothetical protein